ncbi:MAG: cytochrome-c peroxidase [Candidatus Eremiobacteraeota bacterium]|nr:cytochrome-c peroxidase [Candidatus Eremiobacteraeota bacterium]
MSPDVAQLQKTGNALFKPLPDRAGETASPEMVDLGRMLYYEKRLSKDGTISCNSCHDLQAYGVDGESTSLGVDGKRGGRNAPTVYNAALHVAQFWDGRSPDVEDQASGPMLNPVEMAMEKELVETRLQEIPEYQERFAKAFPEQKNPITLENTANAIASFERGLLTPGPFDRFLEGDATALDLGQMAGMKLFIEVGCASCHNGPGLGGGQYQKLGVKKEFDTKDLGRYEVTGKESDKKKFKVPSLRNITQTGPYFHDGSVASLHEGIAMMAEYQLDKELTPDEMSKLEAFLSSLTGQIDSDYVKEPKLP